MILWKKLHSWVPLHPFLSTSELSFGNNIIQCIRVSQKLLTSRNLEELKTSNKKQQDKATLQPKYYQWDFQIAGGKSTVVFLTWRYHDNFLRKRIGLTFGERVNFSSLGKMGSRFRYAVSWPDRFFKEVRIELGKWTSKNVMRVYVLCLVYGNDFFFPTIINFFWNTCSNQQEQLAHGNRFLCVCTNKPCIHLPHM